MGPAPAGETLADPEQQHWRPAGEQHDICMCGRPPMTFAWLLRPVNSIVPCSIIFVGGPALASPAFAAVAYAASKIKK